MEKYVGNFCGFSRDNEELGTVHFRLGTYLAVLFIGSGIDPHVQSFLE